MRGPAARSVPAHGDVRAHAFSVLWLSVILDIKVKVGDAVKKGDTIMVLEAMKMENNIQATSDGTVAKVSVEKRASVLEGSELIVIE